MGRNRELAKNTIFVATGNLGSKLIGFIMLPLYTTWLSPADYGTADIISVYAGLLLNVIAFDVSDAIYVLPIGKPLDVVKKYYSTGFCLQLICSLIAAPLFFLLSKLPIDSVFVTYSGFVYGILISNLFQKYVQDFCRAIKKMSVFSFTGIVQSVSMAVLSVLLVPGYGVYGFVVATIGSNVITTLFTFLYSKSYTYLSLNQVDKRCLREMISFSLPLVPTAIMWWLVSGINRPILEQYTGLFAIGLFAVANKLPTLMNLVFNFFQQAWIVTIVEEYDKEDFCNYFNKMFRIVFSLQMLCLVVLSIAARPFIQLLTMDAYFDAYRYIPLLAGSCVLSNTSAFLGTVFSASKKTSLTFYSTIIGGVTAVGANLLLIPVMGLWGACIAILLSHLASALSRIYFSRKLVRFECFGFFLSELALIVLISAVSVASNMTFQMCSYLLIMFVFVLQNKKIYGQQIMSVVQKQITKWKKRN